LVVQPPTVSDSTPNAGASFTLRATVRNSGTARSAATTLRYYRSSDATISTSDTAVGTDAVSALSASGTSTESISLTAPSTAGTYYYGACADTVSGEVNTRNNCSTGARVTVGGGDGAISLPFVTAASNMERQGFVRIINHSDRDGTVSVHAIDDTGQDFGPVSLSLGAMQTKHFNSTDLETGNEGKGLSRGVGDGSGNWRLMLSTDLNIEALAYIRTADGFVTNMHEVAAETSEGSNRYHVPFFNPGSNSNQESVLRLINPGSGRVSVAITGVDDAGDESPLGEVSLKLESGAARMVNARELEQGGSGLSGGLGDGTGKWRLSVAGDGPLQVMSLLQLPTGHLTNLSRGRDGVTVWTPPPPSNRPDLVVQTPTVSDSTPNAGASFTLRATVRNSGTARSAATTLRYYRSSDATISASDTAVGTDAVSALSASGTSAESISLTAPSSAGTYYYGACVDTVSEESDTANNCSSGVRVAVSSGGKAVTGEITECSGTSDFGLVRARIRGTLQARRSVSSVRVEGRANGNFLGIDHLGSMSSGQSKNFSINGTFFDPSATRIVCDVDVTWREAGSRGGEVRGKSSMHSPSQGLN